MAGTDCPAYEVDYEFFAGSLPLFHTAVVVKQYSSDPADQVPLGNKETTEQVTRIHAIWQFENPNPLDPDIHEDLELAPI